MVERATIRPSQSVYDSLNEERNELGLTWDQYLERDDSNTDAEVWRGDLDDAIRNTDPIDYDHIREIVREEVREALQEVAR